jgi:hypothetical protein
MVEETEEYLDDIILSNEENECQNTNVEEYLDDIILSNEENECQNTNVEEYLNDTILSNEENDEINNILLEKLFFELFGNNIITNFKEINTENENNLEEIEVKNENNLEEIEVKNENNLEEINIELKNINNLEKIQDEYYNKILNSNNNFIIRFIITKKLIKTRILRFYKCWRKGYCLNNSLKKIPKNIKKILLKKI